jgi:hypothetical protein
LAGDTAALLTDALGDAEDVRAGIHCHALSTLAFVAVAAAHTGAKPIHGRRLWLRLLALRNASSVLADGAGEAQHSRAAGIRGHWHALTSLALVARRAADNGAGGAAEAGAALLAGQTLAVAAATHGG